VIKINKTRDYQMTYPTQAVDYTERRRCCCSWLT